MKLSTYLKRLIFDGFFSRGYPLFAGLT